MYFYVDSREMKKEPKKGIQWVAWYNRSTQNNKLGVPHVEIIMGEECQLRAMTEEALESFLRNAYARQPFIKPMMVTEYTGDE